MPNYKRPLALLSCLLLLTSSCARHRVSRQIAGSANPFLQQPVQVEAVDRQLLEQVKTTVSELQSDRVRVVLKSRESLEGIIVSIGSDSFTLHLADRTETIAFMDVRRVEAKERGISGGAIAAIIGGVGLTVYLFVIFFNSS